MRGDIVGLIEAAYMPCATTQDWLRASLAALQPFLDQGLGLGALTFDVRDKSRPVVRDPVFLGAIPVGNPVDAVRGMNAAATPDQLARLYAGPIYSTLSARALNDAGAVKTFMNPAGIHDVVSLRVDDASEMGTVFYALCPKRTSVSPRAAHVFERVAAHMAAGRRIFARPDPDAILSPTGSVEHATKDARQADARSALTNAARRMDRARGRLRRVDPDGAVREWRALVDGRWSLVDHFDHDGRRYVLAVRNEPTARARRPLTRRECEVAALVAQGHSNKLIAYELGLSISTVAGYVANAMTKLGVDSRVALVSRWNAIPRGR